MEEINAKKINSNIKRGEALSNLLQELVVATFTCTKKKLINCKYQLRN